MSKRALYYSGLGSLLLFWVVGQTPNQAPTPAAQPRVLVPPTPSVPGARPTPGVPGANPGASNPASPEANGITADGKMPTIPAGEDNRAIKAPAANEVCDINFTFPKLNAEGLGMLYRQLTGRRVVMTAEVKDLEIYFVQPPPITYGEAIDLLKASCLMHGFVFAAGGDGWDKLTTANAGTKPQTSDIPLVTSPLGLPDGDQVVRYVMTLKHMKPDEVSRVFTSVVSQFNSYGSVVSVPNASALIITENTSLIRTLIDLQAKIDVPSSNIDQKFIKVQYGDVEELSATLNEIFTAQASTQATAGVQRVQPQLNGMPNLAGAQGGSSGSSGAGEAPPVQIIPDLRTNRIFVMARPLDLVFIETLIKEFDSPSDTRNFLRRKLKFLAVSDFLDVASDALSRAFGGSAEGGGAGAAGGGGRSQTSTTAGRSTGTSSRAGASSQFGGNQSSQFGGSQGGFGGGQGGGGISAGGGLGDPSVDTKPVSVLVGRTLLVADNITNSIVVQGPPAGVEIINNLLDEIDVKADQVMISTVFGQLTLSNDFEFGIDWLRSLDTTGDGSVTGSIGGPLPAVNAITNGGLGVYGTIGDHLTGYLTALQETGDFNVISRPTIFTANNQKGMISSGQQIAVPSNSYAGVNGGGQSTNIEYRDVVLALEVIPLVNSEDEVTLQISLVSQGVGNPRKIGAGDNAYEVPDIISRELLTTVTVPNNQTVVLGGLITEENSKNVTGVPILSSIPGLGKLFSTTTDKKSRNELIIFIQPQIIRDERSMDASNRDMDRRYKMSDEIRAFDGPGVLPPVGDIEATKESGAAPASTKEAAKKEELKKEEPKKISKQVSLKSEEINVEGAPKAKVIRSAADPTNRLFGR
jgi:type II secretion system protein D